MRASAAFALLPLGALATPVKRASPAPIIQARNGNGVEGQYIVRMKAGGGLKGASADGEIGIASVIASAVKTVKAGASHTYTGHFNGFAAQLTDSELKKLQNNPNVVEIEQDSIVTIDAIQEDAPWGLSRISNENPDAPYEYDDAAGEGVCSYILDTGIDLEHDEFEGRAEWLINTTGDGEDSDPHGHGTHVAGTVGGKTFGVAKKTKLIAVKVLNTEGSGMTSGIIEGINAVIEDAKNRDDCPKGYTANMSIGGGVSQSENSAVDEMIDSGIFVAVSAGNNAEDASNSSPASAEKACTVGASDRDDKIADFSNFGGVVDVFAPGVDIVSAKSGGGDKSMQGTSMASPHVAGIAAVMLSSGQSVDGLCQHIAENSFTDALKDGPEGTTRAIASNGYGMEKCYITMEYRDDWYEAALRRYRVAYKFEVGSQAGFFPETPQDWVCDWTKSHSPLAGNVQCWDGDDGFKLVDTSFAQGPAGADAASSFFNTVISDIGAKCEVKDWFNW